MLIAIRDAIATKMSKQQLSANQFSFPKHKVSLAMGRYGDPQKYIYSLMQQHDETSLLLEVSNGFSYPNNSQLAVMQLNPIYEDLIVEELLNLKMEKNQQLLDDIERNYTHIIDVDAASLQGYINKTKQSIAESKKGARYNDALLRNLVAAQQLMTMVHEADERNPRSAYLLERYKTDDCGRIYGEGYSLQRMTKEVRYAALGVCHQYDFKACAFAVMAGLAHTIDDSLKIGDVLDYVRLRAQIRERIAKEVNISSDVVKTIFNAIGFGAKLRNTQFSAIRKELMLQAQYAHDKSIWLEKDVWNNLGNDEYQRLLANLTFRGIYDEFQQINATIINYFSDKECVIGGFVYNNIDPNAHKLDKYGKRKKKSDYRTTAQKLAWIYQALETLAREEFERLSGYKALLTTHDCIYFKQKLPLSLRHEILYELQQIFPYLTFEHKPIYPIADQQTYDSRFAEQADYESKHKEWKKEQEAKARDFMTANGINVAAPNQRSAQTECEYELQRKQQFMRDVGITTYEVGSTKGERADYEYNYEYEYDENTEQLSECVAD